MGGNQEAGFTLIEVLVVALIVGILAATALPSLAHETDWADDLPTKADARHALASVEFCYLEQGDYAQCTKSSSAMSDETIAPTVKITAPSGNNLFKLVANANGRRFTIVRKQKGQLARTCTPAGNGGCPSSGKW